ncbi:hypothetical protein ACSNOI_47710, partial [Actinomadura kijaniata]|uniref:hypothetical protein n=1 Tax=Actinomadura kijaniata TaxID=46161 RepID=UPI003F1BF76B
IYTPLANSSWLASPANPAHSLYQQLADRFPHLRNGIPARTVLSHDATAVAIDAATRAALGPDGTRRLPTTDAVRGHLFLHTGTNVVRGASGVFRIDTTTGDRISPHQPPPI